MRATPEPRHTTDATRARFPRVLTAISGCGLIVLAVLTVHVRAANTCLAYRLAHIQERERQWAEHERHLNWRINSLMAPEALARALGDRSRLLSEETVEEIANPFEE